MEVTSKMYTELFNSMGAIHEKIKLANKMLVEAMADLEKSQQKTEEMYISKTDFKRIK